MDSAAACAALFLNIYYLEAWPIPWPLAASPLKLLLFSALAGVAVAAAFYLAGRGASAATAFPLPLDSALGRVLYACAALGFLAVLASASATTISSFFLRMFEEMAGYPGLPPSAPAGWAVPVLLIAWSSWVASRGRLVVARSVRLWAGVCCALLIGACVRFWQQIVAFASEGGQQLHDFDSSATWARSLG